MNDPVVMSGAWAPGHPIGALEARIIVILVDALRYPGGGEGTAMAIELV